MIILKIEKYKKMINGKYKLFLDNGHEVILYEEVILKYELLLHKEITRDTLIKADQFNQEWDVYYTGLRLLKSRIRSVSELEMILLKKEYPQNLVDKAISKLKEQKYLDDRSYVKSFIHNRMITTSSGPYKIERELLDKKIDSSIIQEELGVFTKDEQFEKIRRIIDKGIKTNRNRGGVILKNKIYHDLLSLGYDSSDIQSVLSTYTFDSDRDIVQKEYEKYYRKYSRKCSGELLERKIREKFYLKGLDYSIIENKEK